ncbi:MAG: sigma-70 family RNA polymerase sigma factor [Planctomycetota bacterium]|jgi:RNA polymerase sigma-70 factor (ECF subfamily)
MIMIPLDDLLVRAQRGDSDAFGAIVEQFQSTVYAIAMSRLRDTHEATELAQDVFIHAQAKLGQLRDLACFAGWLRQMTVRMALNRLTRSKRLTSREPDLLQQTADRNAGPLDQLMAAETRGELWEGLDELKPLDRDTLVAFYIRGQSLRQMSRSFETPVGTIKRRLHVARNRLKNVLEKRAEGSLVGA